MANLGQLDRFQNEENVMFEIKVKSLWAMLKVLYTKEGRWGKASFNVPQDTGIVFTNLQKLKFFNSPYWNYKLYMLSEVLSLCVRAAQTDYLDWTQFRNQAPTIIVLIGLIYNSKWNQLRHSLLDLCGLQFS